MPVNELVAYLVDQGQERLVADVRQSVLGSRRFRAFAETYRDKIRKKARGARDDAAQQDLAFELSVAAFLLDDARFALEYEPSGVGRRAADFRVTFRGGPRCNIEARRLRPLREASDTALRAQLSRSICDKLGQLATGMMNVIALGTERSTTPMLLGAVLHQLEAWATAKDDEQFQERGFKGARDFMRYHRRLSGVIWVGVNAPRQSAVWLNPHARHPLSAPLARALERPE